MPKYIPTDEDIWEGSQLRSMWSRYFRHSTETCSWQCANELRYYEEDLEFMAIQDLLK